MRSVFDSVPLTVEPRGLARVAVAPAVVHVEKGRPRGGPIRCQNRSSTTSLVAPFLHSLRFSPGEIVTATRY